MTNGSNILIYTPSYGDRSFLGDLIPAVRGSAGIWADWLVVLGAPSIDLLATAQVALDDPQRRGLQHLVVWPENRGQHEATKVALELARANGYKWLLRLDDDITPKTKRWLKKMIEGVEEIHSNRRTKDPEDDSLIRIVAAPRLLGLRNPLPAVGVLALKLSFQADAMERLGGGCRLHPVEFLKDYAPPEFAPIGRADPESISNYVTDNRGALVRLNHIRMLHRTDEIEAHDSPEQKTARRMGYYWPWLGGAPC